MKQIKLFDSYDLDFEEKANKFMEKVRVIDVKVNTIHHEPTNRFYTQIAVFYEID